MNAKWLDRPIAYHRCFVELGGVNLAVFLSQAIYWHNRATHAGNWFYKTAKEWEDETGLTRREQELVRKKLCNHGILREHRWGTPAKLWFSLDIGKLEKKLNDIHSLHQTANLDSTKPPILMSPNVESTTEITSEITSEEPPYPPTPPSALEETVNPPKRKTVIPPVEPHEWLDASIWQQFLAHRREMKRPVTNTAARLLLRKLEKEREAGQDPNQMVTHAIEHGWQGIYPLKEQKNGNNAAGNQHALDAFYRSRNVGG